MEDHNINTIDKELMGRKHPYPSEPEAFKQGLEVHPMFVEDDHDKAVD